jgi:hypothetical protein
MPGKSGIWLMVIAALLCLVLPSTAAEKKDKGKEKLMEKTSCVTPAKGPLAPAAQAQSPAPSQPQSAPAMARVGQPAPDFEANAFVKGAFKNLKLSDYKGKWTVLCFYPGDFTFV